jgi:hypothetical protein
LLHSGGSPERVKTYFVYVFILRAMLRATAGSLSSVSAPGQYAAISSAVVRPTRTVSKLS